MMTITTTARHYFTAPKGVAGLALIVVIAMSGCRSAQVAEPLTQRLAGSDPETQMEFWHELASRPVTSNDEALYGLALFMHQKDDATGYEERVAAFKSSGLLPAGFDRPANEAVTRGNLAVAIAGILEQKGGLTMRVFGPTPRYAVRELMYRNIYPPSSPNQTFSGSEFVGIIGRMEDFQRLRRQVAAAKAAVEAAPPAEETPQAPAPSTDQTQ